MRDVSGSLPLPIDPGIPAPCWCALSVDAEGRMEVRYHQPIRPSEEVARLHRRFDLLKRRHEIHQTIRDFFLKKGFLETDTPVAVANPGMEPFLDTWSVGDRWLRTSPELHMKRLMAAGFDKIFQMGPCFRKGDRGTLHREEFHMLEWYRVFADLNMLTEDLEALLTALAPLAETPAYFTAGIERRTVVEVFREYLNLELTDHQYREPLQKALKQRGIPHATDDDWDTLYFLLFLNFIEPHLGKDRPFLLTDYPASQSALAKKAPIVPGKLPTCYRFELYLRGTELANAFYEVTDEAEQRTRFRADNETRKTLNKPTYPLDEQFLAALASGLPPSAGIALGVDRLVLALLEVETLDELLPFS
ncbi:MAG: EF-P lysine aminoacylase EpmA [Acidobacteriota bacterium]|nr:EF-P lysine aminoacylase EpmA [Acidobacteriota bacterium]